VFITKSAYECCAKSVAAAQGPHLLFISLPDNYREPLLEQPVVKMNGQRANKLPAHTTNFAQATTLDLHYLRSTVTITWNLMICSAEAFLHNMFNYDKLL
jgi:hypothetical protein